MGTTRKTKKYYKDGRELTESELSSLTDSKNIILNYKQQRQLQVYWYRRIQQETEYREIEDPRQSGKAKNPGFVVPSHRWEGDTAVYRNLEGILVGVSDAQREVFWEEFHSGKLDYIDLLCWACACEEGLGRYQIIEYYGVRVIDARESLGRLRDMAHARIMSN